MVRQLRIQYPGAIYHIMARGNGGKEIFKNRSDYQMFLDIYKKILKDYNWISYAYCLMPNHYHLFIKTIDENLSLGMKQLNGNYSTQYNIKEKRLGGLFQSRFKSILVEDLRYQGELIRYIVLNPIRAGIVKHVGEWEWSSHREMVNEKIKSGCLYRSGALKFFDDNMIIARNRYIEYISEQLYNEDIWDELKYGFILGSIDYVKEIMSKYGNKELNDVIKRERIAGRPELEIIFGDIKNKKERNKKIKEAFSKYGYTQSEIAKYLNIHHASISRIIKMLKCRV